ncbi:hypothetical protein [Sphingomonas quercus]|uniref:Uncharacterized protein n=1 Tax=Sphingomonas quercus TaxID=2842451 RepID=A0ABS6BH97_9SPHN|nr:hypothetical protein [Sphingomonas quercus]MBU3076644.1 hypothetical protein [Sphingomonas quercus]
MGAIILAVAMGGGSLAPAAAPSAARPDPRITRAWLTGGWSYEGGCENDQGVAFAADGKVQDVDGHGSWSLRGDVVTLTIREVIETDEGAPVRLPTPQVVQHKVRWLGPKAAMLGDDKIVKCQ